MKFNDAKQLMVYIERSACDGLTQPEIIEKLIINAGFMGWIPVDLNWKGIPNIYLRGVYDAIDGKYLHDIFVMFVGDGDGVSQMQEAA